MGSNTGGISEEFTGIKDVNGVDIYEGDIIEVSWPEYKNDSDYDIYWKPHLEHIIMVGARWNSLRRNGCPGVFPNGGTYQVKGNIFETPGLLE